MPGSGIDAPAATIVIRPIDSIPQLHQVEPLQKEVWGCGDLEVSPASLLIAVREVGGVIVGAFDNRDLVGFAYGFLGRKEGRLGIHSDMLAVKPVYSRLGIGYRLKLAQREHALAQGVTTITWTFDPLQGVNAYFNLRKLGAIAREYKIDFYGEAG